jgi:hypothetical protein
MDSPEGTPPNSRTNGGNIFVGADSGDEDSVSPGVVSSERKRSPVTIDTNPCTPKSKKKRKELAAGDQTKKDTDEEDGNEPRLTPSKPLKRTSSEESENAQTTADGGLQKKQTKPVSRAVPSTSEDRTETDTFEAESETMDVASIEAESVDEAWPENLDEPAQNAESDFIVSRGSIANLLDAAKNQDQLDEAIETLSLFKTIDPAELDYVQDESKSVSSLDSYSTDLPQLPQEPLLELTTETEAEQGDNGPYPVLMDEYLSSAPIGNSSRRIPNILEYPLPVDTWWPSINSTRRERRQCGETTDEDDFDEQSTNLHSLPKFRINEKKIRHRMETSVKPGVLEKIPHCLLHRTRTKKKKNSTAPELVFCWQVTEIYPNDVMVNCSMCGTWRHAACGGHYRPFSSRENTREQFVPVCDSCYYEQPLLSQYPVGAERIERQRIEQLRRGLMTSAVIRHASYSKHTGTYKWPIGSVSATHIGGHTRSVQARIEKAEKTWSDMISRLGRGVGYRPKERNRVRTKELERLLVSVEDAETTTDRHNMIVFLLRDLLRETPVGYEKPHPNILDPAEDVELGGDIESSRRLSREAAQTVETGTAPSKCSRSDCPKAPRFDSLFCSDACGIHAMSSDLLRTLYESAEIHPSLLRS